MAFLLVGMMGFISAADNLSANSTTNATMNVTNNNTVNTSTNVSAGVLPGSFLYGLDKGLNNLRLALTFNQEKKAQLALNIAQERLAEAEVLAQKGEYNKSAEAVNAHEKMMVKAQDAINNMNQNGNANKSLENLKNLVQVQTRIQNHLQSISMAKEQFLKNHGQNLTQEQLNQVDNLFNSMENASVNASLVANQQRENAQTKYKALGNLTDSELNQTVQEIDSEEGYNAAVQQRQMQYNQSFQTEVQVREMNLERLKLRLNDTNLTQEQRTQLQAKIALEQQKLEQFKQMKQSIEQRQEMIQNMIENQKQLIEKMQEHKKEAEQQRKENRTHDQNQTQTENSTGSDNSGEDIGIGLNVSANTSGVGIGAGINAQASSHEDH